VPRFLLTALLALLAVPASADWRSVAAESQLEFVPTYDGVELPGRFNDFEVRLRFDPDALENACLEVSVAVDSADMDDSELNEGIAGPQWFHFERFPRALFTSTEIRAGEEGSYFADGNLGLKGLTHAVSVPFHWSRFGERAEMEGSLSLSRSDYSIGTGDWADDDTIGDRVEVRFHVVLHAEP